MATKRKPLSRERILESAVAYADEHGDLDAHGDANAQLDADRDASRGHA